MLSSVTKPLIYVTLHPSGHKPLARIYPGEFLGPAEFSSYRTACRANGCEYDATAQSNYIHFRSLESLINALQGSFVVKMHPAVVEAAEDYATAIRASRAGAKKNLANIKDQPYPFQRVGIDWLAGRTSALLGDEMGLGKTPQALLALPADAKVLVVCPASLKGEWLRAAQRWRPDLHSSILDEFHWPGLGALFIINYERLPAELTSEPDSGTFVIADECHYLKSSKSLRTKRFRVIGQTVRNFGGATWGLTGTPMPARPMDLLNVMTAFNLLKESFGTYPRFIAEMNGKQDYWGKWTFGNPKPTAAAALRRVMLRRLRTEVLPDLPTITYQDIEVDIPAAARRASDAAREAMAAAGVDLQAVIEGRQSLGAAAGSVFTARRLLAEAKIPAMLEIMERYHEEEEPLVIFSAHKKPIQALGGVGYYETVDGDVDAGARTIAVASFQDGAVESIGLTIRTGGTGFTLTKAAHAVFVDEEWNPSDNDQAAARLCRIGQTRGVVIKRLIAPGTVDQDAAAILAAKRKIISASVDSATGAPAHDDVEVLMNLRKYL